MAREWQVPHSTLTREWTSKDLQLAIADLLARDDIGPCGQPHSVSTQPGAIDRYVVDTETVCGACARLEEHRSSEHTEHKPGVQPRIVDKIADPELDPEATAFGPTFD